MDTPSISRSLSIDDERSVTYHLEVTHDMQQVSATSVTANGSNLPTFIAPEESHGRFSTSGDDGTLGKKGTAIPSRTPNLSNSWEFAGWGHTDELKINNEDSSSQHSNGKSQDGEHTITNPEAGQQHVKKGHAKLGQWRATSIAGNDLIASVFYTIGVCFTTAGPYAPISLLLVSIVLYPFQKILSEVSTALPMNGGTYNCLLNTASKSAASVAASLSLISYTATAVVSASSATAYLAGELPDILTKEITFGMTIGILVLFAAIVALGMEESSIVAMTIFCAHCVALTALMIVSAIYWGNNGSDVFIDNWNNGTVLFPTASSIASALFLGYSIGLLGITGFETSSNYVEDQGQGVFPKTMRNMWWLVLVFNTPTAIFTMAVLPLDVIRANSSNALSVLAGTAGGSWLRWWITIDAVIVLCAGVLTAFVGVSGLIVRMTADRLLPQILLQRNRFTGSPHWIILSFLLVCCSLYAISGGVMCTFAFGNLLLKYRRDRLPRPVRTSSLAAFVALLAFLAGLTGNLYQQPILLAYFIGYVGTLLLIMLILLHRVRLAKTAFFYVDRVLVLHRWPIGDWLISLIRAWTKQPVAFFTDTDEIHILNKAVLYVNLNESTECLKIIHFYDNNSLILRRLEASRRALDQLYPKITIDLVLVHGKFNPENIEKISDQLNIPKSLMFMSCPGPHFPYGIEELNGVRIIML
ncbi:amino acid permease-domain-containing protein [Syncephalis fuscata]|nr:amino acid permease-domain-containing protein [Syncephalis fuscata]